MRTENRFIARIAARIGCMAALSTLAACQPGLLYGERTSFNLASVHLNDDAAEPVRINFGFRRSIATVAPPFDVDANGGRGSGESASVFSSFELADGDWIGIVPGPLTIRTRFASGAAAVALAEKPDVVKALMNSGRTIDQDSPLVAAQKGRLISCFAQSNDANLIRTAAGILGVTVTEGSTRGTRSSVLKGIRETDVVQLKDFERLLPGNSCL